MTLRHLFRRGKEPAGFSVGHYTVMLAILAIPLIVFLSARALMDEEYWFKRQYTFLPVSVCESARPTGFGDGCILLRVNRSGEMSIFKQALTPLQVSAILTNAVRNSGGASIPIVLLVDSTTKWQQVQRIIHTVSACGIYKVMFGVRRPDGFPSRTRGILVASKDASFEPVPRTQVHILRLTSSSIENVAHTRAALREVWNSEIDFAAFPIQCSPNTEMQSLIDVCDLLETSTMQGHNSWPSLVLEEELLAKIAANQMPENIGTNAPNSQH